MKNISHAIACTACFCLILLAACGDSGTTEKITQVTQSGMDVVSDVSSLPECSAANDGELVWVKTEATPRMCSEGKWYAVAEGSVVATCTTEQLADNRGVKILCGGDSVGVVLNGRDGTDGEGGEPGPNGKDGENGKDGAPGKNGTNGENGTDGKDGVGCSMETVDDFSVKVTCGEESTILYVEGDLDSLMEGQVVLDSEKVAVSLDDVSGFTQKGPFLMGSKVRVYEIADGRSLKQTGNSFNGKILNDKGEFDINARMLVSQYVSMEATGYYRNEITGENSNTVLTLFAITDVTDRKTANMNLLTHLEYERVIYLVTQKKMKVRDAKKQAQKEVFNLLHIDATNFKNSEDLNIAGTGDADAALLAFSVVLQGHRSVSELSELLQNIANDMEQDGKWDDSTTRMALAVEADTLDLYSIYENVKNWKLSEDVADFEKFINLFWSTEYGLGACDAGKLGAIVAATAGPRKGTTMRYKCSATQGRENPELYYYWAKVGDFDGEMFEKDTYGWSDTTDGAIKAGAISGNIYVFDSLDASRGGLGWRGASEMEKKWGGCNNSLQGEYRFYDWIYDDAFENHFERVYYRCTEEHAWRTDVDFVDMETREWKAAEDGSARWGDSLYSLLDYDWNMGHKCFVYDTSESYRGWREGDTVNCSLGLNGCTLARLGQMQKTSKGAFYVCVNDDSFGEDYYTWQEEKDYVKINTYGWTCLDSNSGEIRKGQTHDAYFVCEDEMWRGASTSEERNCVENGVCQVSNCTESIRGTFEERDDGLYVCDDSRSYHWGWLGEWRKADCAEIETMQLCTEGFYSIVWSCETQGNFLIDYVCEESAMAWRAVEHASDYSVDDWNQKKSEYYTSDMHPDVEYGDDLEDERDGNVYKTVYIGGKRWTAENLRYIDESNSNLAGRVGSWDDAEITGFHYYWTAAMDVPPKWNESAVSSMLSFPHRGVCPNGWHVPDTTEWKSLLGIAKNESLQMMGFKGWSNATDLVGFSAIPDAAEFWTSTENEDTGAYVVDGLSEWWPRAKDVPAFIRCIENDN